MILTINGGSSSIKFAAYSTPGLGRVFGGRIERVGTPEARLIADGREEKVHARSEREGAQVIVAYMRQRPGAESVTAIGHRVVHGGLHLLAHQKITTDVLSLLREAVPMDLAHLPGEIELIEAFGAAYPSVPQVACFDTAFFRDLPHIAQLFAIPREISEKGIRRFGFHGISYTYLMAKLEELAGPDAARGRVVLAHLGAGASMAAVRDGKPIDTTMAFTPTAGLVMGTRSGDMDPGLLLYLMRTGNLSVDQMDAFISNQCGLLGVSQTSADMRDLLARRSTDPRAADAVELFCYQASKFAASMAAAMGGMDTLVFSAGIGEHVPEARAAICGRLEFLGIELDQAANAASAPVISAPESSVTVRVIPTDEEQVIANTTLAEAR
jgi:acetate kinase